LPTTPEDYIHRIGRTGRAGTKGDAVSLVCEDENEILAGIEKLLKFKLKIEIVAGFECGTTQQRAETAQATPVAKKHEYAKPEQRHNPEQLNERSNVARPFPRSEPRSHGVVHSRAPQDPLFSQPYTPSARTSDSSKTSLSTPQGSSVHTRQAQVKKPLPALFMPPTIHKSEQEE
jgi:ATP-dependent RNA helicase RhlE